MRSFAIIAAVAGIASAHASAGWGDKPVYVTDVVTAYTTYCPEATHITHGSMTYTVTEPTTLTITNCPCTVTRPVMSSVSTSSICSTGAPAPKPVVPSSGAPVPPVASVSSYTMPKPVVSSTSSSAPASTYTGSAAKVQVAGGLLAALGLVAAAL